MSNTYNDNNNKKANYGFKTRNYPGQCNKLQNFEKDLQDMIKSVKFRKVKDEFQAKMKGDISLINGSANVFMFADKTTNMYEISPTEYKKLLHDNITKTYRKATPRLEKAINMEAKCTSKKINLDDRIDSLAKNPSFITLKDHKPNFRSSLPCWLVNPSKNEFGRVSKVLLENINKQLIELLNVTQWKNSESVIDWFNTIENKHQCVFIQ